jgi:hypothetical protein
MLMPRLPLAWVERDAPDPHEFVLEQNSVADRPELASTW